MDNYYSQSLNSNNLKRCYEIAPDRIKQFLEAEIDYSSGKIKSNDRVLDLGCGYGRVSERIIGKAKGIIGIDISNENIELAKQLHIGKEMTFFVMNANDLKFDDNKFDVTLCLQNGISAFKLNPLILIKESLRVTRKGGLLLISTYSEKIWNERLKWFEIQSKEGLIGEIDYRLTKNGEIVCKDGFTATTYTRDDFINLASGFNIDMQLNEIDDSILFCEMIKK